MRQVERMRQTRKVSSGQFRAYEKGFGPDELDLERNFRCEWAEEHTLVWTAYQLERWARRLALEQGEEPPPRDKILADVRNALEHLDEAWFEGNDAVPGEVSRSLEALPDSRIAIRTGGRLAFGLIDVEELERRALNVVRSVEDELMKEAADWWTDMSSGR